MTSPFISTDDGYSETAYLKAVKNVHSAVWFTYRPCTISERAAAVERAGDIDDVAAGEQMVFDLLADKILSWEFDGLDAADTPEPTAEFIAKLRPPIYSRLRAIVLFSYEGGDKCPRSGKEPVKPDDAVAAKLGN